MADNIQTELGVDANVPVYANAKEAKKAEKEAKKAAKKAEKEAKKADKRRAKAEKKINKAIDKCQKAVKKAEKEKDPVKRQKAVNKAREKLEKNLEKTSKKYPTETKEIIAEKEREQLAKRSRMRAAAQGKPKQPERAFDGVASAYDRPQSKDRGSRLGTEGFLTGAAAAKGEKIDTGDPMLDMFLEMILAWSKAQQLAFEERARERDEQERVRAEAEKAKAQTRSSSGQEMDNLTKPAEEKTTQTAEAPKEISLQQLVAYNNRVRGA